MEPQIELQPQLTNNAEFSTYTQFIKTKDRYQTQENRKWSVHRSKKVHLTNSNLLGSEYHRNNIVKSVEYEYIHYICETSNPRISTAKVRNSTTKKTNCGAYFILTLYKNKLRIVKSNFNHSPNCTCRYSKNPLDPKTTQDAEFLLNNGSPTKNVAMFLVHATGDFYNSKDIHNIFLREQKKFAIDDAIEILKKTGKVDIIHNKEKKIMGITYQTPEMVNAYKKYGSVVVLDSTFKLVNVNWTFFVLIGLDHNLKSVPFYSFIIHNESSSMINKAFELFLKSNDICNTKYVITDKDLGERKSLKRFFKFAKLNLCRFHVVKSFKNKISSLCCLTKKEKKFNTKLIKRICYLEDIREYSNLTSLFSPAIREYYDKNWEHLKKEFVPAFKETCMSFNTHTSNNAESYFNNIKRNLKLMQTLGNFLVDIAFFFEYKHFKKTEEDKKQHRRSPNKPIPYFIKVIKNEISSFALETIMRIEKNSWYITVSKIEFKFDLNKCCTFSPTFGLPCIHFFYNNRNASSDLILGHINTRWNFNSDVHVVLSNDYDKTEALMNSHETKPVSGDPLIRPQPLISMQTSKDPKTIENATDDKFKVNTVEYQMKTSKTRELKLFKKYRPLSNKIASILSHKSISEETGVKAIELLIDLVDQNSIQTVIETLAPKKPIISQNKNSENKLIKDLLESRVEVNYHQKGRKKIKNKNSKKNMPFNK